MRTWGRVNGVWTEVTTDANGFNDAVYLTTLIQVLKLNLGESPFFGNYGIPAHQSVTQQVQPDFYVVRTQRQFAPFFAALLVAKLPQQPNDTKPRYKINATAQSGSILTGPIPE